MNQKQLEKMKNGKGFIAALDQSGGSTPKALRLYGVAESAYSNDEEMFNLVHEMRTRIITSPSFTSDRGRLSVGRKGNHSYPENRQRTCGFG